MTTWTVGQVADLLGVTVRTLHHYDEIGLLSPRERSRAGYRLYTGEDLTRLQQVVVYRRLEMPLDEIATLLEGGEDAADHLRRQRSTVMQRLGELTELVAAIDRALEREMSEQPATTEDLKELFGDGFEDEYQQEAQERWGETDAWKQSQSRTKHYTKADWAQVVGRVLVAVEQGRDLVERQLEPSVDHDLLEPCEVLVGVEPVARPRALARDEQTDLVVVVQRAHRHAEEVGDLPHRPGGHLLRPSGHAPSLAPHVA